MVATLPLRVTSAQTPQATPSLAAPSILVEPAVTRRDERFRVSVGLFSPDDEITIEATIIVNGATFGSSRATYVVSDWGFVDCSVHRPVDGTFDEPDAMGFVWSARSRGFVDSILGPHEVQFEVIHNDTVVATAMASRTGVPDDLVRESIDVPDLIADYYAPAGSESQPAIMVLGGSEGGLPLRNVPSLLAMHGYSALGVAYFGLGGLPDALENIPLEYFASAIAWLQARPEVDRDRIGVIGYSRGGELALLLGAYYPELGAAISVAGSGVVHSGIDWSDFSRPQFPGWTWQGEPIPYVDESTTVDDPASVERVTIPVETINGPVMLIAGEADELWPSAGLSQFAWDRLRTAYRAWPDEFLTYPGAGHLIQPPYQPMNFARSFNGLPFGGNARDDTYAGANSWQAILNMLAWRFETGM